MADIIKLVTSESVTEGHPDKVCDQIADAILDELLSQDKNARSAVEVCATTGLVFVMGEVTAEAYVDVQGVVRKVVNDIGYNRGKIGFDADNLAVMVALDEQSSDIALGVDKDGAGDQGMMYGYASNECSDYMPLSISLAHKLTKRLTEVRKSGMVDYLRPDGKSQVTVEYVNGKVKRIDNVVVSTQHNENVSMEELRNFVIENVIKYVIPSNLLDDKTVFYVNPTGRFVIGGPKGDTGLTGRKIIVDTYGGVAHHGGGAFSGKDPTKVDRSAAYMARYIAKNIVAAGMADKCEVSLSYAIGVANPTSIGVNTFGTGKVAEDIILKAIKENFNLTPKEIIETFDLRRPIYRAISNYGHFGRDGFPWEELNKVNDLKKYL